jgi:hypothetical protein
MVGTVRMEKSCSVEALRRDLATHITGILEQLPQF